MPWVPGAQWKSSLNLTLIVDGTQRIKSNKQNFYEHSPSADSRRDGVDVSYKQKHVHEVLVSRLVKLAQVKECG